LPVPWLAVPGNHDVGDNPSSAAAADEGISESGRKRWLDIFGADRWSVELSRWKLIAVNAQLFQSGLPAEVDQWDWLGAQVADTDIAETIALVIHKPIAAPAGELATAPSFRFVPAGARSRLAELLSRRRLGAVLSGHVHQSRRLDLAGTMHLWAPTTWAVLPDAIQPTFGVKRCGLLTVALRPTGMAAEVVEPDGLLQLTLGRNVDDPYVH
jgi:hypothetical protein